MKHLYESILSKKTGMYDFPKEFPKEPSIAKIKMFLDSRGFEEYKKGGGALTDVGLMMRCKYSGSLGYSVGPCNESDGTWWIMFGDSHKSYMCRDIAHYAVEKDADCRITYGRGIRDSYYTDFETFREKAIKYFEFDK